MDEKISCEEANRLFSYNKKTGILRWKEPTSNRVHKGDIAGHTGGEEGYLQVQVYGKKYKISRLIWLMVYGYWTENQIDHKNRIVTDNRLCNLREVSASCNMRNTSLRSDNSSGVKGVWLNKAANKFVAGIRINGEYKYLGWSKSFDEAVCKRLAAEQCVGWEGCDSSSPAFKYVHKNILDKNKRYCGGYNYLRTVKAK